MKICVLGNSQTACIKAAWDMPENRPAGYELTFFCTFGVSLKNLVLEGRRLTPATKTLERTLFYTSGKSGVDILDYDAFLLCGLGMRLEPVDRRVSNQVFKASVEDNVRSSLAYSLATKIRSAANAPIHVLPPPLDDERMRAVQLFEPISYDETFPIMDEFFDIRGSIVLRQPDRTITQGHFTKIEFSRDAVRIALSRETEGRVHLDDDCSHMNASYGVLRLQDFLSRL